LKVTATPFNRASELALAIYGKVLDSVRADHLVSDAVQRVGDALFIQGNHIDLARFDRVWIAGAGKASVSMATATAEILGERLSGGLIVTKSGYAAPVRKAVVIEAAHPVPDQSSLEAGDRLLKFASNLSERDLVVFVLSGGASALIESLGGGITLKDLQEVNQWCLSGGLNIGQINHIRSRLSRIKGGGLAEAFRFATVVVLVLSDVVGNDLQTIGSGPFVIPNSIQKHRDGRQGHRVHYPAQGIFRDEVLQTILDPKTGLSAFSHAISHYVVGSVSLAIHSAADAAREFGLTPLPYGDPMKGEARVMARTICRHAERLGIHNSCMIFGGETTVTIRGDGLGGRSQEMAVSAASAISRLPETCFLAAGTDGSDGPTGAVGGIIDPQSLARARQHGITDRKALARNDSYHFLEACQGLIVTGPTGSNVNDLALVVHAPV
jgi:glycerate-2-kinase